MKRLLSIFFAILLVASLFSCTKTIPSSEEAKEKMEKLGYDVELSILYGKDAKNYGIQQVTFVFCEKDEEFLQAYFFANEEDTDRFYEINRTSMESNVSVIEKNRYSIYRGTKKAVEDFLS